MESMKLKLQQNYEFVQIRDIQDNKRVHEL